MTDQAALFAQRRLLLDALETHSTNDRWSQSESSSLIECHQNVRFPNVVSTKEWLRGQGDSPPLDNLGSPCGDADDGFLSNDGRRRLITEGSGDGFPMSARYRIALGFCMSVLTRRRNGMLSSGRNS